MKLVKINNNKFYEELKNFLIKRSESDNFSLTYWMNKLQNLPSKKNYFVTIFCG